MKATATDPGAASLSGVATGRMILLAFGISALIGGLGGIAINPISNTMNVSGGAYALWGFVAAVLGGWGSTTGAVVGGLALGIIQNLALGFVPAGNEDPIAYFVLILFLYFRPTGMSGSPPARVRNESRVPVTSLLEGARGLRAEAAHGHRAARLASGL